MGCGGSRAHDVRVSTSSPPERSYTTWAHQEEDDEAQYLAHQVVVASVRGKLSQRAMGRRPSVDGAGGTDAGAAAPLPHDYSGPHFTSPYTLDQALTYAEHLVVTRARAKDMLHLSYAARLLHDGIALFSDLPPLVEVAIPAKHSQASVIVVGDTHGQLADVLYIFATHGPPSAERVYIFNGDMVDRGSHSVEILFLLLAFKLACPQSVHVNRGNHEGSPDINERPQRHGGGFAEEVRMKYGGALFAAAQQLFRVLPVATRLGSDCLVVHGGLPRTCPSLDRLRGLDCRRHVPDVPRTEEELVLFDLLWADPADEGARPAGRGALCHTWGAEETAAFLEQNQLSLIIRSHQLPPDGHGYMLHHGRQVLTLFSASNYCGVCGNLGAILILSQAGSEVWEYRAPTSSLREIWDEGKVRRARAPRRRSRNSLGSLALAVAAAGRWRGQAQPPKAQGPGVHLRVVDDPMGHSAAEPTTAALDADVVRSLKERVCVHRSSLLRAFQRADPESAGSLPFGQWRQIVGAVVGATKGVDQYAQHLVEADADGRVDYAAFLARFSIRLRPSYAGWQASILQGAYAALRESDLSVAALQGRFDRDQDGAVSAAEVVDGLCSFNLGLSRPQVEQALLWMNMDMGTAFDAPAFVAQLYVMCHEGDTDAVVLDLDHDDQQRMVSTLLTKAADADGDGVLERGELVGVTQGLWSRIDTDGDGWLSYAEFADGVGRLVEDGALDRKAILAVAERMDLCKTGRLCFLDFLPLFKVGAGDSHGSSSALIQQICTHIFEHQQALLGAFRYLDPGETGTISEEDFVTAIHTVGEEIDGAPFTKDQIVAMARHCPKTSEGCGLIAYHEFLEAFVVVDSAPPSGQSES